MIWIYGAGGIGSITLDMLLDKGITDIGIIDDSTDKTEIRGIKVRQFGSLDSFNESDTFMVCISDVRVREKLCSLFKGRLHSEIHESCFLSSTCQLAEGVIGFHGARVQTDGVIGAGVILNSGSSIEHHSTIGDYVHVGPTASISGHVVLGEGCYIGSNATILPSVTIGEWAMVGAGSVVTKDVEPGKVVAGVPARVIGET